MESQSTFGRTPWVPGFASLSHHAETSDAAMEEATVDTLIERQRWDLQKFGSLFNPRVGAEILKVKLGLIPRLDAWIYTGEKTGFLV